MFVQVFQGGVRDPVGLRKSLDRWITDIGPKADGWLGTMWGLYGDKSFSGWAGSAADGPAGPQRGGIRHPQNAPLPAGRHD